MEVDMEERPQGKPYALNDLAAEASLPEKEMRSQDLIDYVGWLRGGEPWGGLIRQSCLG